MKTKDNIGVITLFASVADFIATNDWFQKAEICICMSEKKDLSNLFYFYRQIRTM
ncbi:MAG TPA: hypothetical protein PLJ19_00445 [Dysgonamonadaceae bacterium]|nr:hypothetical protein [Dysgonamonadaceae bacterium]